MKVAESKSWGGRGDKGVGKKGVMRLYEIMCFKLLKTGKHYRI